MGAVKEVIVDYDLPVELRKGYSLAKFLREVDTVKTNIGSMAMGENTHESYLITGILFTHGKGASDVMSIMRAEVIEEEIVYPHSLLSLTRYIDNTDCGEGEELIKKLKDIISNRALVFPIKTGTNCMIINRGQVCRNIVRSVKYSFNAKSQQMEYMLVATENEAKLRQPTKLSLSDYQNKWYTVEVEPVIKGMKKENRNIIRFTSNGCIRPIQIRETMSDIIVYIDNTFVCIDNGDSEEVAGYWTYENKIKWTKDIVGILGEKTIEFITCMESYISYHKRFMIPKDFTEQTVVTL